MSFETSEADGGVDEQAVAERARRLDGASPQEILREAMASHGDGLRVAFSGAEDVILVDMACEIGGEVRVFVVDTGRLFEETLEFIDRIRAHYGVAIEVAFPQTEAVEGLVRTKGLYSFRQDGHAQCCAIRKVEPLRRVLSGATGWVTGQRRDQSPDTRATVPVVQVDGQHRDARGVPLLKYNPLAAWSSDQVWRYLRGAGIPFNPLHARGFVSIGCAPCTRPILPGQHEREGRWWWEDVGKRECGLHLGPPAET